jgi:peroxiredoxin
MIHLGVAILGLLLATTPSPATVGKPAPDFTAVDENGATYELAKLRGHAVVLEWTNPDCPFVERHYSADTMEKLAKTLGASDVVWLAVNSTYTNTPADTRAWKAEQGFAYPTLQDADGTLGHLYGARTTPHMFVIDADGVLRYTGAIDDDPNGKATTPLNYVGNAVAALLASGSPDPSETKSYGCSVKYK